MLEIMQLPSLQSPNINVTKKSLVHINKKMLNFSTGGVGVTEGGRNDC